MRFQKPPFLWISTFDCVSEDLRFCGVFVRINVNTFTKTDVFLSVFVQKRSSVNGALSETLGTANRCLVELAGLRLKIQYNIQYWEV